MKQHSLAVRLLAVLMTCVVSGLGLLAIYTRHAPERWTRLGYAAPLEGDEATVFGLSLFFLGLLPLMLFARTPKAAMVFGTIVGTLTVLTVFVGIRFLA
jgi:hypothetical protein